MIAIIFYPSIKTDVLDAQKNHLIETVLLSTHNRFWLRKKSFSGMYSYLEGWSKV